MNTMKIDLIEFGGFVAALRNLHTPYGKDEKSDKYFIFTNNSDGIMTESEVKISSKDMKLLQALRKRGDDHAKVLRGIQVWLEITAPRYWWQEAVTYEVGVTKLCSESTMHNQCTGLHGKELQEAKSHIEEGTTNKRVIVYSYQALSRIYAQRKNHPLPEWSEFCKFIETLPYFEELIKPIIIGERIKGLSEDEIFNILNRNESFEDAIRDTERTIIAKNNNY